MSDYEIILWRAARGGRTLPEGLKELSCSPRLPAVAGDAARFEFETDDDGMRHFEFLAPIEEMAPLVRGVMRIEAELLIADAATVGTDAEESRTPDQRRADALVALIVRASDALINAA
jgi:hypothetical protein